MARVGALLHLCSAERSDLARVGALLHLRSAEHGDLARIGALLHLRSTERGDLALVGAFLHLRIHEPATADCLSPRDQPFYPVAEAFWVAALDQYNAFAAETADEAFAAR
jgi:hypothetical protein